MRSAVGWCLNPWLMALRMAALLMLQLSSCGGAAKTPEGPSVKDIVEFTHLAQPVNGDADQLQSQVSPNGELAFIVTRKADVASNRNRYDIVLLDVRPDRLAAGRVPVARTLLTLRPEFDNAFGLPAVAEVRWLGNHTLVFRARLRGVHAQAYSVGIRGGRLQQLTFASHGVGRFSVSDDLGRIVYSAFVDNPPLVPGWHHLVVGNQSFWSVKFGQYDVMAQQRRYRYFVADIGSGRAARPLGPAFAESGVWQPPVLISPDGRWAVLPKPDAGSQQAWGHRYPKVAEMSRRNGASVTTDPRGYFSTPTGFIPERTVAVRLADGEQHVVLDAPEDAQSAGAMSRFDRLWVRGGRSVILPGTFLPPGERVAAEHAASSHVVEYWPDERRWEIIARLNNGLAGAFKLPGQEAFVVLDGKDRRSFRREGDGQWVEALAPPASASAAVPSRWTLQVEEDGDIPRDVIAVGPQGQKVRLTRLNPQVSSAWGRVRPYDWTDRRGKTWKGGLLLPPDHEPGKRYPLVIQSYGFDAKRFYLDGPNGVDGYTSGYAGRAFLTEGMLVLAMPLKAADEAVLPWGHIGQFVDGVRGAIERLAADGWIDKDRVGLMGFSSTGESVLNLITFSDVPVRAVSLLDGDANTLFSLTITYGRGDWIQARKERRNGGMPAGDTRDVWTRRDPSLNTHCIKAATRMETYGPTVLNNWDIYALLRRQYKAAEMVVIPGGSHSLLTPAERMASLQGNVDWYRFWLQGEERREPLLSGESESSLAKQYVAWREMAELKRIDDAKPRCTQTDLDY